jgi:hypothetical protein
MRLGMGALPGSEAFGLLAVFSQQITARSANGAGVFAAMQLVQAGAKREEVAPCFAFALRRAQEEGRVEHR